MAFTTDRPDLTTMPDVSYSGIALLSDITAETIWADSTIHYGWGGRNALSFDRQFDRFFHQNFGNAQPDGQFAFAGLAQRAFRMIDAVTALDFKQTKSLEEVDLVLVSSDDKPRSDLEGFFQFPGFFDHEEVPGESWSLGAFNSALKPLTARPERGGGQYGVWTMLHEIGHSLGLKHTHQEVFSIPALPSVGKAMNNERYSVMSYNGASKAVEYGHAVSMMALDVAALQALYGAEIYAADDSTYRLMDAKGGRLSLAEGDVAIGRAYYCIWDSGGVDTIDYKGSNKAVLINLNDATLDTSGNSADLQALFSQLGGTIHFNLLSKGLQRDIVDPWHNAGGFFSQVLDWKKAGQFTGADGGYSIAHGAAIENARGGRGTDLLIGNALDNRIVGGGGADALLGGAGNDELVGGKAFDQLDGGWGNDTLRGGAGGDVFIFATGYGIDTIMDFETKDLIDLRRVDGIEDMQDVRDHMSQVGADVRITVGGDQLIIKNTEMNSLTGDNFALSDSGDKHFAF